MAANGHHSSHGAHGGDHRQATDELSPNQHRQHAESDEHGGPGGHGAHGGHGGHGDHAAQFRDRFWLSLALTVPVVAYSEMVQEWLGFTPPQFPGSQWVAPVLGTIVFLYGGRPFLEGGLAELRSRQPGMMLLISLAILVAFGASLATLFGVFDLEFWWELALLIVIMLLGHWLEMRALGQASSALDALAALLPDAAERVTGDGVETVSIDQLAVGDMVLVRPGGRVPADGVVIDGAAELDESMITGESRPVAKNSGDRVVAGTVVTDSALRVRVDAVGEGTTLAGIRRLVEEAQRQGEQVVGRHVTDDAVEGRDLLPRAPAPYGDRARQRAAVVAVDRLTQLEHDVVGDVDRERDGTHAHQLQTTRHPAGGGPRRVEARHRPGDEDRAGERVLDDDRVGLGAVARDVDRRRVAEADLVAHRRVAGDATQRQRVRTVGVDLEIEHVLAEAEQRDRVVTDLGGTLGQHDDPGVVGADRDAHGSVSRAGGRERRVTQAEHDRLRELLGPRFDEELARAASLPGAGS